MSAGIPVDILEKRAADQRRQLHDAVGELRATVRHKLDLKRNVRQHIWPATGLIALLGLIVGYAITGVFTGE